MSSRQKGGQLDDTGWRILDALQSDSRLSFNELARQVGLSAPTVAERVRRMEEAGIIAGYRLVVGVDRLFAITAIIRIEAPEQNCVALGERARELTEVIEAYRTTGDERLILKVVAESVEHLERITATLARYGTVSTSIVLRSRWRPVSRSPRSASRIGSEERRTVVSRELRSSSPPIVRGGHTMAHRRRGLSRHDENVREG